MRRSKRPEVKLLGQIAAFPTVVARALLATLHCVPLRLLRGLRALLAPLALRV